MRVIGIFIGLLLTFNAVGQIAFFKMFTNTGDESGEGVLQLEDSSYMITGSSSSFAPSLGSQAFLLHIDSLGNYISSTHYGGPESDVGKRVLYQPNYGFYIAGYSNSFGAGDYDFYLVKTDENGVEEWSKTYGGTGWERLWDAALMPDSGVMMIGQTNSNVSNNNDMFIVRTDKFGDTLWTKTIGGSGSDVLRGMEALNDSVFYLVGSTYIEDSSYTKGMIFRIRENGDIERQDTIFNYENTFLYDIAIKEGVEMAVVGYNEGVNSNDRDSYFLKFDLNGNMIFNYSGNDNGMQYMSAVTDCIGNNKWYLGLNYFNQWSFPDGEDVLLARYSNMMGWEANMIIVTYEAPETIGEIIKTSDGGVLMVGKSNGDGTYGVNHVFVGKIGPNDSIPDWVNPIVTNIVGFDEPDLFDGISIYPNPASTELIISSENLSSIQFTLFDALGNVVLEDEMNNGDLSLDVSSLENGVYFLSTRSNNSSTARKVIVQH